MSKSEDYSPAVATAREYYNSSDADRFYASIWGGEDIHIGIYRSPDEDISTASERTVELMADKLSGRLDAGTRALDLGAGYGGSARYLARKFGCHVTCVNLSEIQNDRNRKLNEESGLADKIDVIDGDFENVPIEEADFDVIWSQDAILHSGDRVRTLGEVDRLIKPGGFFIMTDPMQADDCPEGVLQPVLDRIHLDTMGSPDFYRSTLAARGWKPIGFDDYSEHLSTHYGRVREEILRQEDRLKEICSSEYVERMKSGLQHWVKAGKAGYLCWGILLFEKAE